MYFRFILLSGTFFLFGTSISYAQKFKPPERWMSKADYYREVIAPAKGINNFSKIGSFADRKRAIFDIGQLVLRFSNAAILGYDRWGFNHEFPSGSKITYYWNMAPMVGAKKRVDGVLKQSVSIGSFGTVRDHENEFEPLGALGGQPEYDSGTVDIEKNIGIAFSDKPESWPSAWPIELDPTGSYTDNITGGTFKGVERGLDMDQPDGNGLRFPGVIDGKVVAEREAYFVVTDNDPINGNIASSNGGVGPLDIRIDLWALQFSDILNQDFITFRQVVTNIGTDTLFEVYVGIEGDPDAPEQGSAEWTDDYALFFPPHDPLMIEKIGVDDSLLWNLGIVWDRDDKSEGFLSSGVGWIGFKVLETPIDPKTGKEKGLTTFNVFPYSAPPQDDNGAYLQMASGIQQPDHITPDPNDKQQKPYSYGPDITWVLASGPFTLPPGESLPFSYASILGVNEKDVLANARLAQLLYNADYRAASPPEEPRVRAVAGDKKVTLYWDAYPSEYSTDPLTGSTDRFEGYRVYKSTDRGRTWGDDDATIRNTDGIVQNYVPVAIYDLQDGITGTVESNPYLDLGSDTGLKHSFVDVDVVNGFEYWYAVCAYDLQDGAEVPPMENSRKSNANIDGDNTVAVVPRAPVAGYTLPSQMVSDPAPNPLDDGKGTIEFDILDPDNSTGSDFDILFYDTLYVADTSDGSISIGTLTGKLYYSLRNLTKEEDIPVSEIADITIAGLMTAGEQIFREESQFTELYEGITPKRLAFAKDSNFFSADNPQIFVAENIIDDDGISSFEGVRLRVEDNEKLDFSSAGRPLPTYRDYVVEISSSDPDLIFSSGFSTILDSKPRAADYRVIFGESSPKFYQRPNLETVPFQVFNLTKDPETPVNLFVSKPNEPWASGDVVSLSEPDISNISWLFSFAWGDTVVVVDDQGDSTVVIYEQPQDGDEILFRTYKPFKNGDMYTFSTQIPTIEDAKKEDLDRIRVVPNPYTVSSIYETSIEVKEVQFTHLPPIATIRIFNIAGELVQTIRHTNETSIEPWNLRSYNDQDVSFGIYIYHVTAPNGRVQMGKMAVIR